MGGTRDDDLSHWDGFLGGLNTKAKPTQAPVDDNGNPTSLLEGVNVVIDAAGDVSRRPGQTLDVEGRSHSLFPAGDVLLAVVNGELRAYREGNAALVLDTTLATVGDRYVTYASDDFSVWWSNGIAQGRIDLATLTTHPFWIDAPAGAVLASTATGGLAAGRYELALTVTDAEGRESGASPPAVIDLTTGQGIAVTLPTAPAGAARWRVYVTAPDGEVFYQSHDLPAAAANCAIGRHAQGAKLETLWLHTMIPTTTLRYGHARLYGLAGPVLVWSQPYRLGLMEATSHMPLGQEATLLQPLGEADTAGCWVADHKRTYWMSGPDPANWSQRPMYPHAAVPGTAVTVPGTWLGLETTDLVAYWMGRNGTPCIGLPGGVLLPQREQTVGLPVDAERGASAVMLFDGIRQILTTTFAAGANYGNASAEAEATVRRRIP